MAHDEPAASGAPTKLAIKNVGLMLSGDFEKPILDADAIVAVNGRIVALEAAEGTDAMLERVAALKAARRVKWKFPRRGEARYTAGCESRS